MRQAYAVHGWAVGLGLADIILYNLVALNTESGGRDYGHFSRCSQCCLTGWAGPRASLLLCSMLPYGISGTMGITPAVLNAASWVGRTTGATPTVFKAA